MNKQQWILVAVLALVATFARAQTVEYIHTDALGSPVAVTNASGAVIERTVYEPYGAVINRPITNGPGYTGHVADAETGLNYMQQRYYDPQLGRFLSNDPVTATSVGGNFNRYWYANNNPYRFIDPDGRQACTGSIISRRDGTCSGTSRLTVFGGAPNDAGKRDSAAGEASEASSDASDESGCTEVECEEYRRLTEDIRRRQSETLQEAGVLGAKEAGTMLLGGFSGKLLGRLSRLFRPASTKELNKIAHVFPRAEKNLAPLVNASGGSELAALRAVQAAANRALADGRIVAASNGILPGNGRGAILNVNGVQVQLIGGRVLNDAVELGSFVGL